ncbi:hypothetical protein [Nocardia callitridis]
MGLPQLPNLPPTPPLPGLPPMPVIDLAAIVRPLTDLVSSFGTGQFGSAGANPVTTDASAAVDTSARAVPPGTPANAPVSGLPAPAAPDPTQVLEAISTGLQSVTQLGTSALQVVMQLWQGPGSEQAAKTGAEAASSGTELVGQSTGQKAVLGGGATSVFTGAGLMAQVMGKYATTAAVTAPFLALPGGQVFLLEATAEAITEALAVVAKTRVEMVAHSTDMTQVGTKVKVTSAPTGVGTTSADSSSVDLQQLMQLISPVGQLLGTAAQSVSQLAPMAKSLSTVKTAESVDAVDNSAELGDSDSASDQGGSGYGGGAFGGGGGLAPAAPLGPPASSTGKLAGSSSFGAAAPQALAAEPTVNSTPANASSSPGMMPMSRAGAMGGAGAARAKEAREDGTPDNLVTSSNGDELVGPPQGASLPVVGALAHPQATEAPPDKEWTF